MIPSQANQHLRQRIVISTHAKAIEQRSTLHRISQQQRANNGMGLADDTLGERMMIVANRANLPVWEKEFLGFERVAAAHDSTIDGDEIFVIDAGCRRTRQPARLGPA